jgi:hypothetical protein
VDVKAGVAFVSDGNVADGAQHFALFVDLDFLVGFGREVEPADGSPFEGANRSQRCRGNFRFIRKARQRCKCFFS